MAVLCQAGGKRGFQVTNS